MTTWTLGYLAAAAVDYTYGYYPELNPQRVKLAFLDAGLEPPDIRVACELGYGQGVSVNIHAAASNVEWWGTDFNPSQAASAQQIASASQATIKLYDQAFAEFCNRSDLPDFDFVGLHGIWSWISDENRKVIVDFLRRKLKVGGVVYISYNTMPGWAAFAPIRDLLFEHAEVMAAPGRGIVSRVDAALEFVNELLTKNPLYANFNPTVRDRAKALAGQNRQYLAHEYLNQNWLPMSISKLSTLLEPAKLGYACSANYLDHVDNINLTTEQQQFMANIPDPIFRETIRDFMVNQQFRRDYWVKGGRKLSFLDQRDALRAQRIVLTTWRDMVPKQVRGAVGEATLNEDVYHPILDMIADHEPKQLGDIERALASNGLNLAQLIQAVLILTGIGVVRAVQDKAFADAAQRNANALNAFLLNRSRGKDDIEFLASPLLGEGVQVHRIPQLFMLASKNGSSAEDLARFAWHLLSDQGQRVVSDGKTLETPEQNIAELTRMAVVFLDKQVPVLKALRVI